MRGFQASEALKAEYHFSVRRLALQVWNNNFDHLTVSSMVNLNFSGVLKIAGSVRPVSLSGTTP
jgi:hypothetical protein